MAMEEDVASQLRRQISQVTSEKEAAKLEFESLKRTVDTHILRLNTVLGGSEVSFERLQVAIQSMDEELRGRLEVDGISFLRDAPAAGDGTYEVLRHSLNDTQRRCQDLNSDMLRVADANEELHSTLKTLKGTNKRLVEEVQKQTEELTNLTQQRILDSENLSRLEETLRQERALWAAEAQRSLEDEQQRCTAEFNRMRDQLCSQIDECWNRAATVAAKSGALRAMQSQLKAEVLGFSQGLGTSLKKLEKELLERVQAAIRVAQKEETRLKDQEHSLKMRVIAEKDIRETEAEAWKNKQRTLAAELDELIVRRDREVADLQSRLESLKQTREAEATALSGERAALREKAEALIKELALLESMTQTSRRKGLQLETHLQAAEGERDRLQQLADSLRHQIRESDEALAAAVRSNEALREQMEMQRLDSQAASERDLRLCREMFDKRLEAQSQNHRVEQAEIARKIRGLEESLGAKAGELQAARDAFAERTRGRDALQRDTLMWKAQHELAEKMKADVEREFAHFKQEVVGNELRRQREQEEELQERKARLEKDRAVAIEEAERVEKEVTGKEKADNKQALTLADLQRDAQDEIRRAKDSLSEVEAGLAAVKADAATAGQHMSERREILEQELARITANSEAEKKNLERKIQAERLSCSSIRDSFEKLRDEHRASFKAVCEGPVQQISALEGTISEIQRNTDAELASLRQKSEKQRARIEELEIELGHSQSKLQQTEQEVQESTSRVNLAKAAHRSARESLERERSLKTEELQSVQRSIARKSQQLKDMTKTAEDTRKRLLREVEEARAAAGRTALQPTSPSGRGASSRPTSVGPTSSRSDVLDRPRQIIPAASGSGAMTSASAGFATGFATGSASGATGGDNFGRYDYQQKFGQMQEVGSQMRKSLASMEDRADYLRRGLQR